MEGAETKASNFTIVPNNNEELYKKNSSFNILHVYIVERVRSFEKQGKTCYIKNEQLAEATGSSEKTISRAIKLLIDEQILWGGYHYLTEGDKVKQQRVLRIFNKGLEEYNEKKRGQIVQESQSNCPAQIDKMTTSDGQNDPLEYNNNIKEYNYKKDDELDSLLMDSHNAHPEPETITSTIFEGIYDGISKNRRRSLEEIEASLYDIEDDEI